jgi:hypothetical protein
MSDKPYRDPTHPGNKLRPRVRCIGCGKLGCATAWGPWCFDCNVERMDRIGAKFDQVSQILMTNVGRAALDGG